MKIIASIQARMGSSRLPGKVLKEINGKPMLLRQIERLRRSRLIDEIVVATTVDKSDDEIAALCEKNNISIFRGSENDVLDRIASLLEDFRADVHVECFGDSPLSDIHIMDEMIGYYLKHQNEYDFVSNSGKTTYPPGTEAIVYDAKKLIEANKRISTTAPLREHVSIHISKDNNIRSINLEAPDHYRFPNFFLEVDTAEDFAVVSSIFEHFDRQGLDYFSLAQILDYLKENPQLVEKNRNIERRWMQFREEND